MGQFSLLDLLSYGSIGDSCDRRSSIKRRSETKKKNSFVTNKPSFRGARRKNSKYFGEKKVGLRPFIFRFRYRNEP